MEGFGDGFAKVGFCDRHRNEDRLEYVGFINEQGFGEGNFWLPGCHCCLTNLDNGFFYGKLDENGKMSDKNGAFIYPDMKTVYVGEFKGSEMVNARASEIVAERCHRGVKEIKVPNQYSQV